MVEETEGKPEGTETGTETEEPVGVTVADEVGEIRELGETALTTGAAGTKLMTGMTEH